VTRQLLDDGFRHVRPPGVELGEIVWMAANVTMGPCFAKCEGGTLSRRLYRALDTLLAADSYPYGDGDGTTTFTLPDLRERFAMGSGAGAGLTARALGDDVGEASHVLTVAEMAAHGHSQMRYASGQANVTVDPGNNSVPHGASYNEMTSVSGTTPAGAHENRQPFLGLVPWICVR
jgi:microcystin-dependent protein